MFVFLGNIVLGIVDAMILEAQPVVRRSRYLGRSLVWPC
ncbi:hypothetical protein [Salipiger pallidus]